MSFTVIVEIRSQWVVISQSDVGLDADAHSEIYQLLGQAQWPSMFVALRSSTLDPTSLTSGAQNAVWSVNKNVPLASVRTMQGNKTEPHPLLQCLLPVVGRLENSC